VLELQESHKVDNQTDMAIQYFLDRFYMSRISMRMLIHQHTLLFEPDADHNTNRIGVIDPACKLKSVIMEAFQNAAFLCEEYYNCAPDIEIKGQTMVRNEKGKKVGLSLVYPPPHLYHILFELFKNSMRATVETHSKAQALPEIEVLLAKGVHDVSIRISDQVTSDDFCLQIQIGFVLNENLICEYLLTPYVQGGGIPRHITDHTFHYLVSTAPRPSMTPTKAPLAGYGASSFASSR
jgi:pyruvate dehydrogenase kinase 2/3/4